MPGAEQEEAVEADHDGRPLVAGDAERERELAGEVDGGEDGGHEEGESEVGTGDLECLR